jgi:hypothetical protein
VVDVSEVAPSELMQLHHSTRDALADSISKHELQTIKLKKRISELEDALSPRPLFAQPLAILSARTYSSKYNNNIKTNHEGPTIVEWNQTLCC